MLDADGMEFRRVLRAILAIDRRHLVAAGLIDGSSLKPWTEYRRDPLRWMLRLEGERAAAFWRLVRAEQDKGAPAAAAAPRDNPFARAARR